MTYIVVKSSKVTGKGDERRVEVQLGTVTSLAEAERAGVVISKREYPDRVVVVTCDGQKLTFLSTGGAPVRTINSPPAPPAGGTPPAPAGQ